MQELVKLIKDKYWEIIQIYNDPVLVVEFYTWNRDDITTIIKYLEQSVENGIFECKLSMLNEFFSKLDDIRYKDLPFTTISQNNVLIKYLLFLIILQRLVIIKGLRNQKTKNPDEPDNSEIEMKEILAVINNLIEENPDYKNHNNIKLILLQLKKYNKEREQLSKLLPQVPEIRKKAFLQNSKKNIDLIHTNIINSYRLLKNEVLQMDTSIDTKSSILDSHNFQSLDTIYEKQIQNYNQITTTILFALQDKYQVRENIVKILDKKSTYTELIHFEIKATKQILNIKDTKTIPQRNFLLELKKEIMFFLNKKYPV